MAKIGDYVSIGKCLVLRVELILCAQDKTTYTLHGQSPQNRNIMGKSESRTEDGLMISNPFTMALLPPSSKAALQA